MTARDAAVSPVVPTLEMAPRHPPPERGSTSTWRLPSPRLPARSTSWRSCSTSSHRAAWRCVFFAAAPITAAFALVVLAVRARAEDDAALAWFSAGLGVGWLAMTLQLISFLLSRLAVAHLAPATRAVPPCICSSTWRPRQERSRARSAHRPVAAALHRRRAGAQRGAGSQLDPPADPSARDTSFTGPLLGLEYGLAAATRPPRSCGSAASVTRAASFASGWASPCPLAVYELLLNAVAAERSARCGGPASPCAWPPTPYWPSASSSASCCACPRPRPTRRASSTAARRSCARPWA